MVPRQQVCRAVTLASLSLISCVLLTACAGTPLCDQAGASVEQAQLGQAAELYARAQARGEGDCADEGMASVSSLYTQAYREAVRGETAERAGDIRAATEGYREALLLDAGNPLAQAGLQRVTTNIAAPNAAVAPTNNAPATSPRSLWLSPWLYVLMSILIIALMAGAALYQLRQHRRAWQRDTETLRGGLAADLDAQLRGLQEQLAGVRENVHQNRVDEQDHIRGLTRELNDERHSVQLHRQRMLEFARLAIESLSEPTGQAVCEFVTPGPQRVASRGSKSQSVVAEADTLGIRTSIYLVCTLGPSELYQLVLLRSVSPEPRVATDAANSSTSRPAGIASHGPDKATISRTRQDSITEIWTSPTYADLVAVMDAIHGLGDQLGALLRGTLRPLDQIPFSRASTDEVDRLAAYLSSSFPIAPGRVRRLMQCGCRVSSYASDQPTATYARLTSVPRDPLSRAVVRLTSDALGQLSDNLDRVERRISSSSDSASADVGVQELRNGITMSQVRSREHVAHVYEITRHLDAYRLRASDEGPAHPHHTQLTYWSRPRPAAVEGSNAEEYLRARVLGMGSLEPRDEDAQNDRPAAFPREPITITAIHVRGAQIGEHNEQVNVFRYRIERPRLDLDEILRRAPVREAFAALAGRPDDTVLRRHAIRTLRSNASTGRSSNFDDDMHKTSFKQTSGRCSFLDGTVFISDCRGVQLGNHSQQRNTFTYCLTPSVATRDLLLGNRQLVEAIVDYSCGVDGKKRSAVEHGLSEAISTCAEGVSRNDPAKGLIVRPPAEGHLTIRDMDGVSAGREVTQRNTSDVSIRLGRGALRPVDRIQRRVSAEPFEIERDDFETRYNGPWPGGPMNGPSIGRI